MNLALAAVTDVEIYSAINRLLLDLGLDAANSIYEVCKCVSHRVFLVHTNSGKYSVKQLSSSMLQKKNEYQYHVASQKIAQIAVESGISAVVAIRDSSGNSILSMQGKSYIVHEWINYHRCARISPELVYLVGKELARVHNLNIHLPSETTVRRESYSHVNWSAFETYDNLVLLDRLKELEEKCLCAFKKLSRSETISHCDMTPNNVLVNNCGNIILIDWDAAGYINVEKDILQTMRAWCRVADHYDRTFVEEFIKGYSSQNDVVLAFEEFEYAYLSMLCEDFEWIQDCVDKNRSEDTILESMNDIVTLFHQMNILKKMISTAQMV